MGDRLGIPGAVGFWFCLKDVSSGLREGNTPFERAGWRGAFAQLFFSHMCVARNGDVLSMSLSVRPGHCPRPAALKSPSPPTSAGIWSAVSPRFPFHAASCDHLHVTFHSLRLDQHMLAINGWQVKGCPVVYDHTTLNTPVLVRSLQLSNVGPG